MAKIAKTTWLLVLTIAHEAIKAIVDALKPTRNRRV